MKTDAMDAIFPTHKALVESGNLLAPRQKEFVFIRVHSWFI